MNRVLVFETEEQAHNSLEEYIERNIVTVDRILGETKRPYEIGTRSNITSFCRVSVTEADGKKQFNFGEGIESYAAEYETALLGIGYDSISGLVECIRGRVKHWESELYGAAISPLVYTVNEQYNIDMQEIANNIEEALPEILKERYETQEPDDQMKEELGRWTDAMRNDYHITRGLTAEEREEFENLFYQ